MCMPTGVQLHLVRRGGRFAEERLLSPPACDHYHYSSCEQIECRFLTWTKTKVSVSNQRSPFYSCYGVDSKCWIFPYVQFNIRNTRAKRRKKCAYGDSNKIFKPNPYCLIVPNRHFITNVQFNSQWADLQASRA